MVINASLFSNVFRYGYIEMPKKVCFECDIDDRARITFLRYDKRKAFISNRDEVDKRNIPQITFVYM